MKKQKSLSYVRTGLKNTSGPWELGGVGENLFDDAISVTIIGADGFPVAEVERTVILPDYPERLGVLHWADAPGKAFIERSTEEVAANANLIKASPEIYEALKELYEYMVDRCKGDNFQPMLNRAKIALDKAEGNYRHLQIQTQ